MNKQVTKSGVVLHLFYNWTKAQMLQNVHSYWLMSDTLTPLTSLRIIFFIIEFLFCEELTERTTGADIFDCLNGYITGEGFQWEKCVGLCTDGVAAMTGKKSSRSR